MSRPHSPLILRRPRRLRAARIPLALAPLALLAAACVAVDPAERGSATPEPTEAPTLLRPLAATATPTPRADGPLSDGAIRDLLAEAVCWLDDPALASECLPPAPEALAAIAAMGASGDARFAAPLIDMLWLDAGWTVEVREALERLTGERFTDPVAWYDWYARLDTNDRRLPAGYATWKGRLLALVDERFAEFLADGYAYRARPEEFVWGHVGVDEIPPLDAPSTVHRVEERYLTPDDIVYGVLIEGVARAYPERIVAWHEAVNDTVAGVDLLVARCVPCGSASVFLAMASNGERYDFGSAGLVHDGRRLLHDRQTGSLWDPVAGEAVAGPLAPNRVSLTPRPVLRTTWLEWRTAYPNTTVLDVNTGHIREYDPGAAIRAETASPLPRFPAGYSVGGDPAAVDGRLQPKTLVVGLVVEGESLAFTLGALEAARFTHAEVGGRRIALVSNGPGLGVSAYDVGDLTLVAVDGDPTNRVATDAEGGRWFLDEEELMSTLDGRRLPTVATQTAYWFAWAGAHPGTALGGE